MIKLICGTAFTLAMYSCAPQLEDKKHLEKLTVRSYDYKVRSYKEGDDLSNVKGIGTISEEE